MDDDDEWHAQQDAEEAEEGYVPQQIGDLFDDDDNGDDYAYEEGEEDDDYEPPPPPPPSTAEEEDQDAVITAIWTEVLKIIAFTDVPPHSLIAEHMVPVLANIKNWEPEGIRLMFEHPIFVSVMTAASFAWQVEIALWMYELSTEIGLIDPLIRAQHHARAMQATQNQKLRAIECRREVLSAARHKMATIDNMLYQFDTHAIRSFVVPGDTELILGTAAYQKLYPMSSSLSTLDSPDRTPPTSPVNPRRVTTPQRLNLLMTQPYAWPGNTNVRLLLNALNDARNFAINRDLNRPLTIHDIALPAQYMYLDHTYNPETGTRDLPPAQTPYYDYRDNYKFVTTILPLLSYPRSRGVHITTARALLVHMCRTMTESGRCPLLVALFAELGDPGAPSSQQSLAVEWDAQDLLAWCTTMEQKVQTVRREYDEDNPRLEPSTNTEKECIRLRSMMEQVSMSGPDQSMVSIQLRDMRRADLGLPPIQDGPYPHGVDAQFETPEEIARELQRLEAESDNSETQTAQRLKQLEVESGEIDRETTRSLKRKMEFSSPPRQVRAAPSVGIREKALRAELARAMEAEEFRRNKQERYDMDKIIAIEACVDDGSMTRQAAGVLIRGVKEEEARKRKNADDEMDRMQRNIDKVSITPDARIETRMDSQMSITIDQREKAQREEWARRDAQRSLDRAAIQSITQNATDGTISEQDTIDQIAVIEEAEAARRRNAEARLLEIDKHLMQFSGLGSSLLPYGSSSSSSSSSSARRI